MLRAKEECFYAHIVFIARCTLVQSAVLWSHVVCLSVCNVGGLWSHRLQFFWNNFTINYTGMFALCRLKHQGSTPRGTPRNFGPKWPLVDLSVGDIGSQTAAEWLQIAQRSQWRAYRKPPSLCRVVLSLTHYDLPFPPKWGFHIPQDTRMVISLQRVIRYTLCLVLGWGFRWRRIKWRYCQRHVRPIYFTFGDNITSHHCWCVRHWS